MAKRIIISTLGALILIIAAAALLYQPLIRPWHLRYGATGVEVQAALPGDAIITGEVSQATRALVLRVVDAKTGLDGSSTWGFYLNEQSSTLTRLVIRHRDVTAVDTTDKVINAIFEPVSFVMEEKMLRGLRDHAEMQ